MENRIAILQKAASWFYKNNELFIHNIEKKEFGYGVESKIDARHLSFNFIDELKAFLIETRPLFLSYSTAFYKFPSKRPMEAKGWDGAEIVFDLDIDVGEVFNENAFDVVRQQTIKLVEEFLLEDFGIDAGKVKINFSGHKGFHIHVCEEEFFQLSSKARRELVDYIQGIGLDSNVFIRKELVSGREVWVGPKPDEGGYGGRLARNFLNLIKNRKDFDKIKEVVRNGIWEPVMKKEGLKKAVESAMEKSRLSSVRVDAPVTYDIYRLIRVPDSFYGATGWKAKTLSLSELTSFNPKHDALALPSDRFMKICAIRNIPAMEFCNTSFDEMKKGEMYKVPIAYGIFLIGKGLAVV